MVEPKSGLSPRSSRLCHVKMFAAAFCLTLGLAAGYVTGHRELGTRERWQQHRAEARLHVRRVVVEVPLPTPGPSYGGPPQPWGCSAESRSVLNAHGAARRSGGPLR